MRPIGWIGGSRGRRSRGRARRASAGSRRRRCRGQRVFGEERISSLPGTEGRLLPIHEDRIEYRCGSGLYEGHSATQASPPHRPAECRAMPGRRRTAQFLVQILVFPPRVTQAGAAARRPLRAPSSSSSGDVLARCLLLQGIAAPMGEEVSPERMRNSWAGTWKITSPASDRCGKRNGRSCGPLHPSPATPGRRRLVTIAEDVGLDLGDP